MLEGRSFITLVIFPFPQSPYSQLHHKPSMIPHFPRMQSRRFTPLGPHLDGTVGIYKAIVQLLLGIWRQQGVLGGEVGARNPSSCVLSL
jgi:hypothetical protein